MRLMLPSTVVKVIEEQFAWTKGDWRTQGQQRGSTRFYALNVLPGILRMIERIPEDLLPLDSSTDAQFTMALAALEDAIERGRSSPNNFDWCLIVVPGMPQQEDCLVLVKNILASCPDNAPSKSTKGMTFVADSSARETLLVDLGSAERALNTGDWKACTVISGSIVEALLLWVIDQKHSGTEITSAITRAATAGKVSPNLPPDDLTHRDWSFHAYIHVADELGETSGLTNRCLDAKDYRNLIHPAVTERKKAKCDKGSSHHNVAL